MRARFKMTTKMMTMTAALGLSLAGCGGGGGSGAEIARFTGTWSPTSGTLTGACPDTGTETDPVTEPLTWQKGVSSDLVQPTPPCVINADADGSTASGSGPSCTFMYAAITYTQIITSYTFVLAPDGRTGEENGSGTIVKSAGGASVTCTMTQTASYQKIGE